MAESRTRDPLNSHETNLKHADSGETNPGFLDGRNLNPERS